MLLVSIHDVTPAHDEAVRGLWAMCREHEVTPALFVVPDWHGAWPVKRHPDFVEWIAARAAEGADIVLHGLRHDEVGTSRSWADQLRAWGKTDGEGEFLVLDRAAARARIGRGISLLRGVGLDPIGFAPPAWLARPATHEAVTEAGLAFSEDDRLIYCRHSRLRAPCVRWSTRTTFRARASVGVANGRRVLHRRAAAVRLALHPPDVQHAVVRRSVSGALTSWVSRRRVVRYRDLCRSGGGGPGT